MKNIKAYYKWINFKTKIVTIKLTKTIPNLSAGADGPLKHFKIWLEFARVASFSELLKNEKCHKKEPAILACINLKLQKIT